MSIYKVDTESIIALSRLLHVGANAVDQTMRQSGCTRAQKDRIPARRRCVRNSAASGPTRSAA